MVELPPKFVEMLHDLMSDEASDLINALNSTPVTSVRLNKRKPGAEFSGATPVVWCKSGFYLEKRPEFILDPLLHAGAYYVQDASSMIYETLVLCLYKNLSESFGKDVNLKLLDLCAAPGGKTTAMINSLPDGCEITANEYSSKRIGALRENLDRWGYRNIKITNRDSSYYASLGECFDIIAVDAPCSGEGMMRKEEKARIQWSEKLVDQCSDLQKEILTNAAKALKPGGFLIYSTCTFNRRENEENAEFINKELGLNPFNPEFPQGWNIPGGIDTYLPVFRFMPHKTQGEGLFLAVFQKPGIWKGAEGCKNNKKDLKEISTETYPCVDVDKDTAISYLRRESIKLKDDSPLGVVTITYKGLPLGQAKNIGSRANNLLPKNRRILKR